MFERFSEPARQVVVQAAAEARTLGHLELGTDHLLLGVLHELPNADALGRRILVDTGATAADVRARVIEIRGSHPPLEAGQIPFTQTAKQALEAGVAAAEVRGHRFVGSEHLLLGILDVDADAFAAAGLDAPRIRNDVERLIGPN